MTATENQTIADMVVEDFARSTVFEKHQIDYCCHGKRTLREVCEEKGLSLEQIAGNRIISSFCMCCVSSMARSWNVARTRVSIGP